MNHLRIYLLLILILFQANNAGFASLFSWLSKENTVENETKKILSENRKEADETPKESICQYNPKIVAQLEVIIEKK